MKRLCKPLQKVFVLDAHAIARLAGQPPAPSAALLATHSASRARALGARPAGPSVRRGANHRAGRGRVLVRPWGGGALRPRDPLAAAADSGSQRGVARDSSCCRGPRGRGARESSPPVAQGVVAAHLRVSRASGPTQRRCARAGGGPTPAPREEGQRGGSPLARTQASSRRTDPRRGGGAAGPTRDPRPRCWCEEIAGFQPGGSCHVGTM